MDWKEIEFKKVDYVERCIAEFEITALNFFETIYEDVIHYGAFKVKVYERQVGETYIGVTNLRLQDSFGGYEGGLGSGKSMEQALENTVNNFIENIMAYKSKKGMNLSKEDFVLLAYDEF